VIHLHPSQQRLSELLLALVRVHLTTQSYIQISEQLKVLARQQLGMKQSGCTQLRVWLMVLEMAPKIPLRSGLQSEPQVVLAMAPNLQMVYTQHHGMQAVQELEVRQLQLSQHSSEPQVVQELEPQTIRFFTRILELDTALVPQPLEMKHSVCTPLHVLPRETVAALNLQDNCFRLLEPHQQVRLVGQLTPLFMGTYVLPRLRAEQRLEMQQLPSTRHLEQLLRKDRVLSRH
jgi:hypothetical protein